MTAGADAPHIGLVVEGAGDKGALPILLRSYLHTRAEYRDIFGKPVPAHGRDKALKATGLEGYVATAAARPGCRAVLVVLDGEGDCVAHLGPSLLARTVDVGKPVVVALADRDFESWLYASAETLELDLVFDSGKSGQGAIKDALKPRKYVKPTWQPRLTARMDFELARTRNHSLERFLCKLDQLVSLVN
ncbi:hypothetical protein C5C04_11725 [Rathayibacter rathayi]|uniref:DUF4276 domain-containing protein n=1 Tax=Rathayibacter rathayi TaxID=33887 RepID=A0ABD6W6V6_RATRA|nr:hypothetical protein C5C04_11725 [Rathayibacter rathayi]